MPTDDAHAYLAALKEPDLAKPSCRKSVETYRLIIHEFHLATSVSMFRLDVDDSDHAIMTVKRTDTALMGRSVKLIYEKSRVLTAQELADFRRKFAASGFWTLAESPTDMSCTPNGAELIEVAVGGRYHQIVRYCGIEHGPKDWLDYVDTLYTSIDK